MKSNKFTGLVSGLCFVAQIQASVDVPFFSDFTNQSNLFAQDEAYQMGGVQLSIYAGGVAWIDYNNDGWQDLYVPNLRPDGASRLFKNLGSVGTNGAVRFAPVNAGVELYGKASTGVAVGDYDGDGLDDLFVTNTTSQSNSLLRNMGDGRFEEVTADLGLMAEHKSSYVAAFGDLDSDGDLDLYAGNWEILLGACEANDLYINNGPSFTRLDYDPFESGCTFAAAFTDYNLDGKLDLFVVNDDIEKAIDDPLQMNKLYVNGGNSAGNPALFEVGNLSGINRYDNGDGQLVNHTFQGMGIAIGDYNNDGGLDYHRTSIGPGPISTNNNSASFLTTFDAQLWDGGGEVPGTMGWGTAFADVNNDSFLDLISTYSATTTVSVPVTLFLNDQGVLEASNRAAQSGLVGERGNGLAIADYDNDGDTDIVTHSGYGDLNLYRNDSSTGNDSLKVHLHGLGGNHRGIGSVLKLTTQSAGGGRIVQTQETHAGSSHGSTHSANARFGVGQGNVIEKLSIRWPSGCPQDIISVSGSEIDAYEADCLYPNNTRSISGSVIDQDTKQPVKGAFVRVMDESGRTTGITTTDASGQYRVSAVPSGALYGIQTFGAGYNTRIRIAFVASADITRNFEPSFVGYIISGRVQDINGDAISDAAVEIFPALIGDAVVTVTDDEGGFEVTGFAGDQYYVRVRKAGYSILPGGAVVDTFGHNVHKNYVAQPL